MRCQIEECQNAPCKKIRKTKSMQRSDEWWIFSETKTPGENNIEKIVRILAWVHEK